MSSFLLLLTAGLAAAVQDGLAFVQGKAMMAGKVAGEGFHLAAVQMLERSAAYAANMQVAFRAGVMLKTRRFAAFMRSVTPQPAFLA